VGSPASFGTGGKVLSTRRRWRSGGEYPRPE
jgi:hypothetical protein